MKLPPPFGDVLIETDDTLQVGDRVCVANDGKVKRASGTKDVVGVVTSVGMEDVMVRIMVGTFEFRPPGTAKVWDEHAIGECDVAV